MQEKEPISMQQTSSLFKGYIKSTFTKSYHRFPLALHGISQSYYPPTPFWKHTAYDVRTNGASLIKTSDCPLKAFNVQELKFSVDSIHTGTIKLDVLKCKGYKRNIKESCKRDIVQVGLKTGNAFFDEQFEKSFLWITLKTRTDVAIFGTTPVSWRNPLTELKMIEFKIDLEKEELCMKVNSTHEFKQKLPAKSEDGKTVKYQFQCCLFWKNDLVKIEYKNLKGKVNFKDYVENETRKKSQIKSNSWFSPNKVRLN